MSEPFIQDRESKILIRIPFSEEYAFEDWSDPMNAKIIDDDWVEIPSYYRFLQIPSAMSANCTHGVLSGTAVLHVSRRRAKNARRSLKKKTLSEIEKSGKHGNEGIPIAR